VASETFEDSLPGAVERREKVLERIQSLLDKPSPGLNKGQFLPLQLVTDLLTKAEERNAAVDAYNRHRGLTTRYVMVEGRQVLFLDPSIRATPAQQIMKEALRSDQNFRGRFFGFFGSAHTWLIPLSK
jgi:hypothetical protein